ncbi:Hypothetical protein LOCK900_2391 [Lacticaseibacillus rhamnosus LOCK900]|uniref:Uncharacterized protein n=1 Tax=Lacticaseibacillus rhamnosus LRHMDP3 TaxID=1203259 RepID=A0AB33XRS8_LACRH|nr:Hypothetical protein LOCK900_2391 [Lacticaseibacillus rhamnosus LOCK900]EHJ32612.1 hypothetical protein HMPREF0541_01143 [Lacticaseibacillus rhamnosus ATCC 21052]EKS48598.1 hypothetical protein LRHMDP2_2802 [Lacticaseibacillus rhamnosus LRHMDP2]EKS49399.1 hypothetical protein LRHMDP3_2417 [Lacticaseibacillus rhamnosus LRHMDP3]
MGENVTTMARFLCILQVILIEDQKSIEGHRLIRLFIITQK